MNCFERPDCGVPTVSCHFRNTVPEMILSILLAVGVCLLGSVLLAHGFFHDFAIFWLCFVIAGSQYSLLKVCSVVSNDLHICIYIEYNFILLFSRILFDTDMHYFVWIFVCIMQHCCGTV